MTQETGLVSGTFLCGCLLSLAQDQRYLPRYANRYTSLPISQSPEDKNFPWDVAVAVCPWHGAMPYGWRTPLTTGAQGQPVIDYSKLGRAGGKWKPSTVEDRRMNDDPETMGKEILSARQAETNGEPREESPSATTASAARDVHTNASREFLRDIDERWPGTGRKRSI